jgi:hypothetical protein
MLEASVYLKLLTFAQNLATRHFKLFVIFGLVIYAVILNLQIADVRTQNAGLFDLLQKYKDRMIEMKDEHNDENAARLREILDIWKAAYEHERMINENNRKIQRLK